MKMTEFRCWVTSSPTKFVPNIHYQHQCSRWFSVTLIFFLQKNTNCIFKCADGEVKCNIFGLSCSVRFSKRSLVNEKLLSLKTHQRLFYRNDRKLFFKKSFFSIHRWSQKGIFSLWFFCNCKNRLLKRFITLIPIMAHENA